MATDCAGWHLLGTPREELRLEHTLPTGQSFRWRETGDDEYIGVIGQRVVQIRQLEDDVAWRIIGRAPQAAEAEDTAVLADYFNLSTPLADLVRTWSASCDHFARIQPYFQGARMLRQDPTETLFQFLCSSNNHISRIHGMVERLCSGWGTRLPLTRSDEYGGPAHHAFPTLDQLAAVSEADLRAAGFGYRARFVTGSVARLRALGGEAWLATLRAGPPDVAVAALCTLPGVGPKVAACAALFSLDAHALVPVDVHVLALATRHYLPALRGKALTPALHAQVQAAFVARFGAHAGWAHNTLFISELARYRGRVPGTTRAEEVLLARGSEVAEEVDAGPDACARVVGMDGSDASTGKGGRARRKRKGGAASVASSLVEEQMELAPTTPPQAAA
ncbi:N-glycosylase/DNA lyase [Auxenochlorella protothecoides]|nr:N-glycosylase/DNA lyase [Auxenochlorella protothecoides]KFM26186.1 N-glycosylase/DNA lyase [Auxenochlorella protothecoides]RMZ56631.1 hypothetical protein APUTEX25_002720 [Auxenochlorella protothecoides]|eukprot:RMZ56631.1 hypothetical protein APUTEX25_002720 [Auxenochlorella protothecoides]